MKNTRIIVIAALLGLGFTTGFTCSKNAPTEPTVTETPAPPAEAPAAPAPTEQEQMGTPSETAPAAPAEGAPAAPPAGETK